MKTPEDVDKLSEDVFGYIKEEEYKFSTKPFESIRLEAEELVREFTKLKEEE